MITKHITLALAAVAAAVVLLAGCESADDARENLTGTSPNTSREPVVNDPDDPSYNSGKGTGTYEPVTKTVSIGTIPADATTFSGKTPDGNLSPNSITVKHTIGSETVTWTDNGTGTLSGSIANATTGTISYTTGNFTINYKNNFGASGSVSVTYTYNP